jgi:hypothetical protein
MFRMAQETRMTLMELPNLFPPNFGFPALVREVEGASIPWTRHYSDYQSGGWWTCSLLGRSVDARDGEVTDARPLVTDALETLPRTRRLLEELRFSYMTVRLARLDPDGALWEHRDYQNLPQVPRQRIHLPLDTNPGSFLVSGGRRFHMGPGSLWTFRPTMAHGACNSGGRPRVHLIIDAYEDERLKPFLAQATPSSAEAMPRLSAAELAATVKRLRAESARDDDGDFLRPWERAVLKLYFAFAVPEGELYEALRQACFDVDDMTRARFWEARGQLVLGNGLQDA